MKRLPSYLPVVLKALENKVFLCYDSTHMTQTHCVIYELNAYMKVILLQDVAKIGKRFTVTNVPDGYAINQLIPKKLALPATPENLKRTLRHNQAIAASKEADVTRLDTAVSALAGKSIIVTAEANQQGHLFQAIHEADIVAAATASGIVIDVQMLRISNPIKALGDHEVYLVGNKKEHPVTVTVIKK